MQNLGYNKKERSRLSDALSYFISTVLGLLLIFLLIRTYEIVFTWSHIAGQGSRTILLLSSFFYDILFFLEAVAFIGAIYLVLFFIHKSTAKVILNILSVIVALIYLLLVLYFSKSAIPLGSDLFGYSLSEIQETVTAAGGMNPLYFLFFAIFVAVVVMALLFFRKIKFIKKFLESIIGIKNTRKYISIIFHCIHCLRI